MAQPRILKRLDRKRPFGTVYGPDVDYSFEQDRLRFDHQGIEVPDDPNENVVRPDPNAPDEPVATGDEMVEVVISGVTVQVKAKDLARIVPAMAAAGVDAPPAVQRAMAAAQQEGVEESIADMPVARLREVYKDIAGKGFKPGTSAAQMRELLNAAIAATQAERKAA
jgi:hypothetical protein